MDGMIVDASEHVGQPGLRIHVVELRRILMINVAITAARSAPRAISAVLKFPVVALRLQTRDLGSRPRKSAPLIKTPLKGG